MRTGTPIGKNNVALCIERIFAEEPRQVDHKYAILRNQQQSGLKWLVLMMRKATRNGKINTESVYVNFANEFH